MLDKDRILIKVDEMDRYLSELKQIVPGSFDEYLEIQNKRSCERLLQLSIESVINICNMFVSGLKLGIPSEENDLFDKLRKHNILSKDMVSLLKSMRGFRNILIHEYAGINDEIVFETARNKTNDFKKFKSEILKALKKLT